MSNRPQVARTWPELRAAISKLEPPVVLVPTMGALHQGHLDLVERASRLGGNIVVSIFVNPLQFGPGEDLDAYPRTFDADLAALTGKGVSLVYAPSARDMYPNGHVLVSVDPGPMAHLYEGRTRQGHFSGVLTVVRKLLARTDARIAVFGQKDAQQLELVRAMVRDLDMDVKIEAVATRRDVDGLAISSRNIYLSAKEREHALVLPRAISAANRAAESGRGVRDIRQVLQEIAETRDPSVNFDYLEIVEPRTFTAVADGHTGPALVIGALQLPSVRLIDNAPLELNAVGIE